jgi:hypothetical protein
VRANVKTESGIKNSPEARMCVAVERAEIRNGEAQYNKLRRSGVRTLGEAFVSSKQIKQKG